MSFGCPTDGYGCSPQVPGILKAARTLPTGFALQPSMGRAAQFDLAVTAIVRRFRRPGEAPTARPYHGLSASRTWSADTARLMANTERALANEAGGPVAQLLPVPQDGGDGGDEGADQLSGLKADIKDAKGAALLIETTSGGLGSKARLQRSNAPIGSNQRLGPMPPEASGETCRESAFARSAWRRRVRRRHCGATHQEPPSARR